MPKNNHTYQKLGNVATYTQRLKKLLKIQKYVKTKKKDYLIRNAHKLIQKIILSKVIIW